MGLIMGAGTERDCQAGHRTSSPYRGLWYLDNKKKKKIKKGNPGAGIQHNDQLSKKKKRIPFLALEL